MTPDSLTPQAVQPAGTMIHGYAVEAPPAAVLEALPGPGDSQNHPSLLRKVPLMDTIEPQPTDKGTRADDALRSVIPADVLRNLADPLRKRPFTPHEKITHPDGRITTRLHVHRCCNGCGREIGDVTSDEINRAIDGLPLPDVREECGCAAAGGTS